MTNENKHQEFEIFQLLFDKDLATSENPEAPFKSFIARKQSFVNQILDYMHAPGKEGFFTHLFLGNAVALLSTRLNEQKIHAKKIYYRFDTAKTLKIVVASSSKEDKIDDIHLFIFTEDIKEFYNKEHHNENDYKNKFEFSKNEINSIIEDIEKDKTIEETLRENTNKFTLVEMLKSKYILKIQKDKPGKINTKEVYVYLDNNDLYYEFRLWMISKEIKISIGIGENQLNTNIEKFKNYISKNLSKEESYDLKSKIEAFLSKKGFPTKKNDDDDDFSIKVKLDIKDVVDKNQTKEFKPILTENKIDAYKENINGTEIYEYLEDYIAQLSGTDISRTQIFFEKIITYVQQVHSVLNMDDNNAYGYQSREANQHGFLVGIFQMDRYRDNVRIFIEQFAGKGLSDTILLILGAKRVSNSIPILIEHKAGKENLATLSPSAALNQSKEYAKGLQTNRMRFLTTAEQALCVGINFDYRLDLIKILFCEFEKTGRATAIISSAKLKINSYPGRRYLDYLIDELFGIISGYNGENKRETKEKILGVFTFKSEIVKSDVSMIAPIIESMLVDIKNEKSDNEVKKYITKQLERIYYGFPGTRSGQSNHCFSRFLLGCSSIIDSSKYRKYAFIYDESSTIKTDNRPRKDNPRKIEDESHAVTTVVFVSKAEDGKVVIMNFIEGSNNSYNEFKQKRLSKETLKNLQSGSKKIVEINLFFDITKKNESSDFFEGFNKNDIVEHENLDNYINYHKNHTDFKGDFSSEISVPGNFDKQISGILSPEPSISWESFFKEVSKIIFQFKDLIKNEYDFQVVLDGIFCTYSDKKPNESVVLTEYQTGLGNRIDMIIHQKGNPIIGLELKIATAKESVSKLKEAENQINKKYEKSVTYKVLEDIDINKPELNTIKLIGVVLISDAFSAEKLIICSEKANMPTVEIRHSSIALMGHEPPPGIVPSTSRARPKTPRRDSTDTIQPEPKRPASADNKQKPEHMAPSTSQKLTEKMDIDANLTQQMSSTSDSSDSVINPSAQVPNKPNFSDLTKPR